MASGLLVRGTLPRDQAVLTRSQPGAQYCTAAAQQPVCAMVNATHVNRDTLLYSQPCQVSNMPKTVLCQVQYIAQRLFAPFPLLIEWRFLKSLSTGRDHTNYAVSLSAMASWIWKARRSSLRAGAMHQVAGLVRFSQPRAHVSLFSPPSLLLESHKKGLRPTASDRWKLLTF